MLDGKVEYEVHVYDTYTAYAKGIVNHVKEWSPYVFKLLESREQSGCPCLCEGQEVLLKDMNVEQLAEVLMREALCSSFYNDNNFFSYNYMFRNFKLRIHKN